MAAPQREQRSSAPAAPGRRERRRRELHRHIRDTARRLFREHGFEATTARQIAEAADIAPATFFNHFPTKEHVLREMAEEVFSRFQGLVDEQRERGTSTAERLRGFAERGARVVQGAPDLTRRVLIEVLRSAAPPGSTHSRVSGIQRHLALLLDDGRAQGDVRTDQPVEFQAEILASVVFGCITSWLHDPDYPLRARMRESMAFLAEALRPAG
ncbi:MAG: helix-turn-helix domain-containing protein [Myxococcota bacterium]|nr:helix-turn-helix domain-containing protein [Myxococcota bacterium]